MTDDRDKSTPVLDQYEQVIEDTAKLSDRRQTVNNLYLSANSLLLGGIALLAQGGITTIFPVALIVLISVVGGVLCFDWRRLIQDYRRLVRLRVRILKEIEATDAFKASGCVQVYHREDELYQQDKDGKVVDGEKKPVFGFSRIERNLPTTFGIVYILVIIGTGALHWSVIAAQFAQWGIALPH